MLLKFVHYYNSNDSLNYILHFINSMKESYCILLTVSSEIVISRYTVYIWQSILYPCEVQCQWFPVSTLGNYWSRMNNINYHDAIQHLSNIWKKLKLIFSEMSLIRKKFCSRNRIKSILNIQPHGFKITQPFNYLVHTSI